MRKRERKVGREKIRGRREGGNKTLRANGKKGREEGKVECQRGKERKEERGGGRKEGEIKRRKTNQGYSLASFAEGNQGRGILS